MEEDAYILKEATAMKRISTIYIFMAIISVCLVAMAENAVASKRALVANVAFANSVAAEVTQDLRIERSNIASAFHRITSLHRNNAGGIVRIIGTKNQSVDVLMNNFVAHKGVAIKILQCSFSNKRSASCNRSGRLFPTGAKPIHIGAEIAMNTTLPKGTIAYPKYDILVVYN